MKRYSVSILAALMCLVSVDAFACAMRPRRAITLVAKTAIIKAEKALKKGQKSLARKHFRQAAYGMGTPKERSYAATEAALLYADSNAISRAIALARQAVLIKKDYAPAHAFLGQIYVEKKSPMAIGFLEKALVLGIEKPNSVRGELLKAYMQAGKLTEAHAQYALLEKDGYPAEKLAVLKALLDHQEKAAIAQRS